MLTPASYCRITYSNLSESQSQHVEPGDLEQSAREMMNAIKAQRPELYKKVTDWQTINKVLTRVPDTVVVEIELWSLVE